MLYDSITSKLFSLPDETRVYPRHDYNGRTWTTIGEEKQWNPRIGQGKTKNDFVHIMDNLNLALPKKINEAVAKNMACGLDYDAKRFTHEDFSMDELHAKWKTLDSEELILDNPTPEKFAQGQIPGSQTSPLAKKANMLRP